MGIFTEVNEGKRVMTEEEFTQAVLDAYKDGVNFGFKQGLAAGTSMWAILDNGIQIVGVMRRKLSDVLGEFRTSKPANVMRNFSQFIPEGFRNES